MTGRHALPNFVDFAPQDATNFVDFALQDATDTGADRWPIILTADGVPAARVTDPDTADTALDLAAQIARDGWPPVTAIIRALQDHLHDGAEGSTSWPGWLSWPDWLNLQQTEEESGEVTGA
jgi:hypothetical protein